MGTVTQKFDGDASGLEKELAKLQKEIVKLREENQKAARESVRDANAHERAVKRLGEAIKREQTTPLEEYRQKLGMIREAEKQGIITREQANRAAKQAAQAAKEATPAYQRLQQTQAEAAKTAAQHAAQERHSREELQKFADGVKRNLDPLISYREQLTRLRNAHRSGDLTQAQYRASVEQLKRSVRESSPAYQKLQRDIRDAKNETDKHQAAVKRFAESVKRDIATPLDQYKTKLLQLREAHKSGELSQEEYRRAVDRLKTSVRGVAPPLEEAQKKQNLFAGGADKLRPIAASYISIGAAISYVTRELQLKLELERESQGVQVSIGDAQAGLRSNLSGLSPEQRRTFIDQVQGLQKETGFQDLAALNQAASSGISGGGTTDQVLDTVRQAALVSRQNTGQLETLVGAGIDIGKASGITDARSNLGFVLSAGAVSRPTSLEAQARNIPTAVIGVAGTDATNDRLQASREGAAAFAVLSNAAADARGESSATASISLATQMRDFFAAEGRTDPQTFGGRLRALQQDEALRNAFLENASFEQKFKIPSEQLLTGGSDVAKNFEAAVKAISFDKNKFDELATDLGAGGMTSQIRLGATQREAEAIEQEAQNSDVIGARRAQAREILMDSVARTNDSYTATWRQMGVGWEFATEKIDNPEQLAIERLRALVQSERRTLGFLGETDKPSEKSQQDIEYLEKQIALLERIAKVAEGSTHHLLPNQQTIAVQKDLHR